MRSSFIVDIGDGLDPFESYDRQKNLESSESVRGS